MIKNKTGWLSLAFLLFFAFSHDIFAKTEQYPLTIYVFWAEGCPHCEREIGFTRQWAIKEPNVRIHYLEVTRKPENEIVFASIIRYVLKHEKDHGKCLPSFSGSPSQTFVGRLKVGSVKHFYTLLTNY